MSSSKGPSVESQILQCFVLLSHHIIPPKAFIMPFFFLQKCWCSFFFFSTGNSSKCLSCKEYCKFADSPMPCPFAILIFHLMFLLYMMYERLHTFFWLYSLTCSWPQIIFKSQLETMKLWWEHVGEIGPRMQTFKTEVWTDCWTALVQSMHSNHNYRRRTAGLSSFGFLWLQQRAWCCF